MNKKKYTILIIFFIVLLLWISGIIPEQIGKAAAINYVTRNYSDKKLTFISMDFSSAHDDYFARFTDEKGKTYNLQMTPKYFPVIVWWDPFNPQG